MLTKADPVCFAPPEEVVGVSVPLAVRGNYQDLIEICAEMGRLAGLQILGFGDERCSKVLSVWPESVPTEQTVSQGHWYCPRGLAFAGCTDQAISESMFAKSITLRVFDRSLAQHPEVYSSTANFQELGQAVDAGDMAAMCDGVFQAFPEIPRGITVAGRRTWLDE